MTDSSDTSSQEWHKFAQFYTDHVARYTALFAQDLVAGSLCDTLLEAHTVLDIGCGPGVFVLAYLQEFPQGIAVQTIICSDVSPEMVAQARHVLQRRLPPGFLTKIVYIVQDGSRLAEIPDSSVSIVVSNFALDHIADRKRAVQAICRVLEPGGKFGCTAWTHLKCGEAITEEGYGPAFADIVTATWDALANNALDETMADGDDHDNDADTTSQQIEAPVPSNDTKVHADGFHSVTKTRSIHTVTWPHADALWNMICGSLGSKLDSYEAADMARAKTQMTKLFGMGEQWLVAKIVIATK